MELRQLRCLIACAQTKSFSKAAALLYTSQSNVSKTIASLENELGRILFDRRQHGIELTRKGEQVYRYALSTMECSAKILECIEEEEMEELRVSFQPSSWFADAFCEYYLASESERVKYSMISAPVEEILRRIIANQDQLGFAYIEDSQLKKLKEMFPANHVGYYSLQRVKTVLYCGLKKADNSLSDLPLIQGLEDTYSGISLWKAHKENGDKKKKLKVRVSTNSDYIMQAMLQSTELSNISPGYISHNEKAQKFRTLQLDEEEQAIHFVCLFRNDQKMEEVPKRFLSFIKEYINGGEM